MAINLPRGAALVMKLVAFGLMVASSGPMLSHYASIPGGPALMVNKLHSCNPFTIFKCL
jgi:hypothetical protein